jgi:hypothetical protein
MSNESFLNYAYATTGLATVLLALAAWQWLRRPLGRALRSLPYTKQSRILLRSVPATFFLAAIATFFANVPGGCGPRQTSDVAFDRSYTIGVMTKAFQEACVVIVVLVFLWCLILAPTLLAARRAQVSTNSSSGTISADS